MELDWQLYHLFHLFLVDPAYYPENGSDGSEDDDTSGKFHLLLIN